MNGKNGQPRGAQTLDKGLRVLELLAEADSLSVAEIAEAVSVHRSVVSRLLVTLSARRYVERRHDRRFILGSRVLELGRGLRSDLRAAATPFMLELAERVNATTVLTVASGREAVVMSVAEPPGDHPHLTFKLGSRHPIDCGAEGVAILAGQPERDGERPAVGIARARGYAVSTDEVEPGTWGLAAPIMVPDHLPAAGLAVIALRAKDERSVAAEVLRASHLIAERLCNAPR